MIKHNAQEDIGRITVAEEWIIYRPLAVGESMGFSTIVVVPFNVEPNSEFIIPGGGEMHFTESSSPIVLPRTEKQSHALIIH